MSDHAGFNEFYSQYLEYLPLKNPKKHWKCLGKITEELGEVAEACLAFDGNDRKKEKLASEGATPKNRLGEEIMDVIVCCLNLANATNIDIDNMFRRCGQKLHEKTEIRKAARKKTASNKQPLPFSKNPSTDDKTI